MTTKEFFNGLIENPASFLKNLAWSLDHSERGFSLKKIMFVYMVVIVITALYGAYIWFRLRTGHFDEFVLVLGSTLTWAGYLIKLNANQEKDILNSKNKNQ